VAHLLTISEIHSDNTFDDTVVAIRGFNIFMLPFVLWHIHVKLREDLMSNAVEVIWLQIHLPHLKPISVGSCYRPPSANSKYLDNMCEMLDNVCAIHRGVYFLGDRSIDWLSSSCPLKKRLQAVRFRLSVNLPG
jgi:hypothetical protein